MPFRRYFGSLIQYDDALIGGLNVELSPENTLVRRPGWTAFNSVGYSGTPQGFYSAIIGGVQYDFLGTTTNVYQFTSSATNSLFTKGTTAQTFFQQVGNLLFFSDGTNNKKWDGTAVTNNGIATPPSAPTITSLNLYDTVGASQTVHGWVPGYTYTNATSSPQNYFLEAPTGEIYWTVIPKGTSLTSQVSAPNWASQFGAVGGVINDGQLTWTNCGVLLTWLANTGSSVYSNSAYVTTGTFNSQKTINTVGGGTLSTTGSSTIGNWVAAAPSPNPFLEIAYITGATGIGATNTLTAVGMGFAVPSGATINGIRVAFQTGNSGINGAVTDNVVQLLKAGTGTGTNKAGGQWAYNPNGPLSQRAYGSNTDLWGTTWTPTDINNANFGFQLQLNVNTNKLISMGVANIVVTVYYTVASSDISGTVFASVITDSNGNLQRVKVLGTTGGSRPTWATTIGATTTDNTMTWECLGTANRLPCLFNRTYAFGFHTNSLHLSTLSPTLQIFAPIIGNNVPITSKGSDDGQCDRIDLYRTADGGSLLLYDNSAPNVNASTSWTINDVANDSDLNFLLLGPINHVNDPPPAGATILAFHMGRMWAAVGNLLYFSAGPDCVNGDGNQAWPPANVFPFSAAINGLAPTTQGLVVYTSKDMEAILGGPQTATFWPQPLLKNYGILTPNCLAQEGDEITIYTTQQQMWAVSPSGRNEFGFNIAPTLASNFPAATSYVALHRSGQDQGVFICDGSANSERYNMNAEAWDTLATPSTGLGPIASIDLATSPPVRALVTAAGGLILKRDPNSFSDNGSAYAANAVIGSVVLSSSGEAFAAVDHIFVESAAVGTALTVSILANEVSGAFTSLGTPVAEPYQLPASSTINTKRYDWKNNQSAVPQLVKHMQIKITLPSTDTVKNEINKLSIV